MKYVLSSMFMQVSMALHSNKKLIFISPLIYSYLKNLLQKQPSLPNQDSRNIILLIDLVLSCVLWHDSLLPVLDSINLHFILKFIRSL